MQLVLLLLAALSISLCSATGWTPEYEVWIIDQSDTTADGGGTLYIYEGDEVQGSGAATAVPEVVDLGGEARTLCLSATGTAPRRPHMVFFNKANTHAIISFVSSGHVLFMKARTREPIACIDVGVQAHAALPSHDETFVVVANQGGKLLQRILTDYSEDSFVLDNAATIDLATCTTASGALCEDPVLRPNNQPVCGVLNDVDSRVWVTLAGGGLFVVDPRPTPMQIVGEYDNSTVHANGCGGVEARHRMYINSGGPLSADVYSFPLAGYSVSNPPNTPVPRLVYSHDGTNSDAHGMLVTDDENYLWTAERFGNTITVVELPSEHVVHQFSLVGSVSSDPAPDLIAISPDGKRVFAALRGPIPLTQNTPLNNAVGSTPGLGVIKVTFGGKKGEFIAKAPISHVDATGVERADPHGIGVRLVNWGCSWC